MNIEFYDDEFNESKLIKAQFVQYLSELSAAEMDDLLNTIISSKTKAGSYPAVKEIIFENHPEKSNNLKCIHFKSRLYMVEIKEIVRIQHLGRNAFFYFRNSDEFMFRCRLTDLADALKAYTDTLIRIRHTEYVNLSQIREIHKNSILLSNKEECIISRDYMPYVRNRLKGYNFIPQ